jgi:hypothetical protein
MKAGLMETALRGGCNARRDFHRDDIGAEQIRAAQVVAVGERKGAR